MSIETPNLIELPCPRHCEGWHAGNSRMHSEPAGDLAPGFGVIFGACPACGRAGAMISTRNGQEGLQAALRYLLAATQAPPETWTDEFEGRI